jgi:hypothetical protein
MLLPLFEDFDRPPIADAAVALHLIAPAGLVPAPTSRSSLPVRMCLHLPPNEAIEALPTLTYALGSTYCSDGDSRHDGVQASDRVPQRNAVDGDA